ncbi:MAG: hypothetical protein K2G25_06495, partial [Oscillospiraceae bacterium]|nr:hypothetical protein [Oscillospiraceae bacterium]
MQNKQFQFTNLIQLLHIAVTTNTNKGSEGSTAIANGLSRMFWNNEISAFVPRTNSLTNFRRLIGTDKRYSDKAQKWFNFEDNININVCFMRYVKYTILKEPDPGYNEKECYT